MYYIGPCTRSFEGRKINLFVNFGLMMKFIGEPDNLGTFGGFNHVKVRVICQMNHATPFRRSRDIQ